eukprot:scaffold115570_cov19-Prasinocladus_malaysianus.AAC.1
MLPPGTQGALPGEALDLCLLACAAEALRSSASTDSANTHTPSLGSADRPDPCFCRRKLESTYVPSSLKLSARACLRSSSS